MALTNDPVAAEESSQARFCQDHVNGATVGAGLGLASLLPLVEELLHFLQA